MMMSNVFGFFGFYFEIKTKPKKPKKKTKKKHGFYYAWFFESRTLPPLIFSQQKVVLRK
jgi:hypothetical protein